jgi:hypothetical protein
MKPPPQPARALYDGPVKTHLTPFDPLAPHTRPSLPPTFLLALIAAIIGIPLYLLYNGVLKSSGDTLEDKMKAPDTDGRGSLDDEDDDDGEEGGRKKKKKSKEDPDEPSAILEVDDLKSLGGLVGFAAVVVLTFAIFPDDLNGMIGSLTGGMDSLSLPGTGWLGGTTPSEVKSARKQEEVVTERTIRGSDGTVSGFTEKVTKSGSEGSTTPPLSGNQPVGGAGTKMTDMLGGRSMIDLCEWNLSRPGRQGLMILITHSVASSDFVQDGSRSLCGHGPPFWREETRDGHLPYRDPNKRNFGPD